MHKDVELILRSLADRYADAIDRGDGDALTKIFTADAVLISPRGTLTGKAALRALPGDVQSRYDRTFHAVFNQVSEIERDRASARTYCIARHLIQKADSGVCVEMTIIYHDAFVREDGIWLIARRVMELLWSQTTPVKIGL